MSKVAIQVRGLKKSYGEKEVLPGIDFDVQHGEILAFLGPNGAGKTTTVEILEGFRQRDGGEVLVLGVDPAKPTQALRKQIGVVLQSLQLEPLLTVRESLQLYAGYYEHPRDVEQTLAAVGLQEQKDQLAGKLSGGQQRRLDLAIALIGDPQLVFLDEPTTGFDPSARRAMWKLIENLKELGKTVFLTTHYLDEAQELADRVIILRDGKIIVNGPPSELVRGHQTEVRFTLPEGKKSVQLPRELAADVQGQPGARQSLFTEHATETLYTLTQWAITNGVELSDLEAVRPSLEDIYLNLTTDQEG